MDHIAINPHLEEGVQSCGSQDGRAVLARGYDGDFEALTTDLMDESNGSLIGLYSLLLNDVVDQVVLTVSEAAHRFGFWPVV
jgi:hypothetical protein